MILNVALAVLLTTADFFAPILFSLTDKWKKNVTQLADNDQQDEVDLL